MQCKLGSWLVGSFVDSTDSVLWLSVQWLYQLSTDSVISVVLVVWLPLSDCIVCYESMPMSWDTKTR